MQYLTLAAITALTATASAKVNISFRNNATCDYEQPRARIVNRCPYDVYVWTVDSDHAYDCRFDEPVVLGTGDAYAENFRPTSTGAVSIKISKNEVCEQHKITQLEYNTKPEDYNFLDISFVDCETGECPGRKDGYYLQSGNQDGLYPSAEKNEHCPICVAHDELSAAKCAYVLPDDLQTKSCDKRANLDFYLCGSHAPGEEPAAPIAKPSYSKPTYEPKPETSTKEAPVPTPSTVESYVPDVAEVADVAAPTITGAPTAPADAIMTVYETVYATQIVQPHRHRRHQHIHA
jgi:hypothetical protein